MIEHELGSAVMTFSMRILGPAVVASVLTACGADTKDVTCGVYLKMSDSEQREAVADLFKHEKPAVPAEDIPLSQEALINACRVGGKDARNDTLRAIVEVDQSPLSPPHR